MNYFDRQLLAQLSQRYVTGVMPYLARRRFRDVIREHDAVEEAVLAWEDYFLPLALAHKPIQPSDLVWQRIKREVSTASRSQQLSRLVSRPAVTALLLSGLIITSMGWWYTEQQPPELVTRTVVDVVEKSIPEEAIVSVMGQAEPPVWVVKIYPKSRHLLVAVSNLPDAESNNDYELWALKNDKTPVSLGVLPKTGKADLALDDAMLESIMQSSTLAVSLEPLGGSPENVPTGPVLYTAQLLFN